MRLREHLERIDAGPDGPDIGAFFDLDGTLVAGFTGNAFFADQVRHGHVDWWTALRTVAAAVDGLYLGGDPTRGGELAFRALAGQSEDTLADLGERLFAQQIAATVRPDARALVHAHHRRGHTVVVSSAATRYQVSPVARDLGISHLVCTELDVRDGVLTGDVRGRMVWGAEKAKNVRAFASRQGVKLHRSYAYGNGVEDIDFLATVGAPVALSPDAGLRSAAGRFGWPVLELADPSSGDLLSGARTIAALAGLNLTALAGATVGLVTRDRRAGNNAGITLAGDLALRLAGVRLEVSGAEHLEEGRPGIVVANHQSSIDPVVLATVLRGDFTVVAKKEARFDPRALLASALLDPVYIDRSDSAQARAALEAIGQRIESGTSLLIFPEGTRAPTPVLGRFRKGAFHLAVATGAPVLPIVLRNTGEILPRHAKVIRPGVVQVRVLPPVRHWEAATLDHEVAGLHARFQRTLTEWPEEG